MKNKLLIIISMFLIVLPIAFSLGDSNLIVSCGGDEQLLLPCSIGDLEIGVQGIPLDSGPTKEAVVVPVIGGPGTGAGGGHKCTFGYKWDDKLQKCVLSIPETVAGAVKKVKQINNGYFLLFICLAGLFIFIVYDDKKKRDKLKKMKDEKMEEARGKVNKAREVIKERLEEEGLIKSGDGNE